MTQESLIKAKLPDSAGIYFFKKGNPKSNKIDRASDILYVGKATSLRDRVRSYFSKDLIDTRGPLILKMVNEATTVTYIKTDSVLEALILEANTIKKFQPIYNSKEKDDKSYNFVVITNEAYPRVLIERGRSLAQKKLQASNFKLQASFGPFTQGVQLKEALKIIRKIFPFRDKCVPKNELKDPLKAKPCFNRQIGLCPGVCTGEIGQKEYKAIVRNIELFFSGNKKEIERNLNRDMKKASKELRFEDANRIKNQLFALNHIRDVSLIKKDMFHVSSFMSNVFRIEAYDIAHISGKDTVGVMVVVEDGELNKNQYRKFRIKGVNGRVSVDDIANLSEVLTRRFSHTDWLLPNLIVMDGGVAQKNIAQKVLKEKGLNIEIVSVVKNEHHKAKDILGFRGRTLSIDSQGPTLKKSILQANNEAHRFAIAYHRNLRNKPFEIKQK
jgi:excinuclease ABC subunit C